MSPAHDSLCFYVVDDSCRAVLFQLLLLPPPCRAGLCDYVSLSVILFVCLYDYCRINLPISLPRDAMPVLTLQQVGVVNAVAGGPWPPSRKL